MSDTDQIQLLHDFQAGDAKAFEQAFKLYYKPLRIQAFLILNDEQEAEDQVQQLFLDIWNRQLYRNVQESLKAYLHTAIRNRCFNCLTKAKQVNKLMEDYIETIKVTETQAYTEPALQPVFHSALKELPAQRFRAFYLVHLEDKKYYEAAMEMGISINSLKSHLKLAVKYLKMRLQR